MCLCASHEGNPLCFISFSDPCFPADYRHFVISAHYLCLFLLLHPPFLFQVFLTVLSFFYYFKLFFLLILLLFVSLCDLTSVCLSLPSIIFPLPLESLYLSHSLSLEVSRHCSVFPQCLVTVADFLSIQLLIGTT